MGAPQGSLPTRLAGLCRRAGELDWVGLILVLLGVLMVNQFFAQLQRGSFGADGFEATVTTWAADANVAEWTRDLLRTMGDASNVLGPLLGVFVAVSGVLLMLLVARAVTGLIVSIFFFALWYFSSATSGIWTFEYLFPAMFGFIAALAAWPASRTGTGEQRVLGPRVLAHVAPIQAILVATPATALLWYFLVLGRTGDTDYMQVATFSVLVIAPLLLVTILLDERGRIEPIEVDHPLSRIPWVDVMIIVIGAMMCIQVFADLAVGWYNTSGYRGLVTQYSEATSAPGWWRSFLAWTGDQATWLWPLQAVAEFACAFFLATLLIRPIAVAATLGFFGTLMFSEFGVSATIRAGSEKTWEWEMMFLVVSTVLLLMATLPHLPGMLDRGRSLPRRIIGRSFYPSSIPLSTRVAIAVAGGALLFYVGVQTRMFGSEYLVTSIRGSTFFFACLVILAFLDPERLSRGTGRPLARVPDSV